MANMYMRTAVYIIEESGRPSWPPQQHYKSFLLSGRHAGQERGIKSAARCYAPLVSGHGVWKRLSGFRGLRATHLVLLSRACVFWDHGLYGLGYAWESN